jgi:hypothetical protein
MKLDQLIETLLEIQEDLKDSGVDTSEVDVLAGTQPTYPLTSVVLGAISGEVLAEHSDSELSEDARKAVWMATDQVDSFSSYSPYAPKALWEAIR